MSTDQRLVDTDFVFNNRQNTSYSMCFQGLQDIQTKKLFIKTNF